MESKVPRPTAMEASVALRAAETARANLADRLVMPSWLYVSMGTAIAVQIATTAVALRNGAPWLMAAGLAAFAAVAGAQLGQFRRLNGVWLGGFASRVVLGTGTTASVSYLVALAAAIWVGYGDQWWLVAPCSALGGTAYALSGRRWMREYRADPAAHARGESLAWLALTTAAVIGGLALLVLTS
jgi:hypothetical protein